MRYYITEIGAIHLERLRGWGLLEDRILEILEGIEADKGPEDFLPEEREILDWLERQGYIGTTEEELRRMGLI